MTLAVEAFREDTENLTQALMSVVDQHVGTLPYVDRAIIVAAALANVACTVDCAETRYTAECTTRLKRIVSSWKRYD